MTTDADETVRSRVTDKERFDYGVAMVKAYYDALESRLTVTVGLFVGTVGWLITSTGARQALSRQPWLLALAVVTLTVLLILYAFNVAWWVHRWAEIRRHLDDLNYLEREFYVRYELPKYGWAGYVAPVALLYGFVLVCLFLIGTKRFID
ncbi:MAG: hypothetical protein AB7N65_28310 [Vicinamibacterales bacterium]